MSCQICEHAKIQAINAALGQGRLVGVVATQFRVNKMDLLKHLGHAPTQAVNRASGVIGLTAGGVLLQQAPEQATAMPMERPLTRWKQAWLDAKDDDVERVRMIGWLQDQLHTDDMGLP